MSLKSAAYEAEIAALKKELEQSTKGRDRALASLEKARATRARKPQAKRVLSPKKSDLVEVIFADLHGAKQDPAAVSAFLADLKVIKPDRIVMVGDILDCSGFLAAHHTMGYIADTEDSYEDDIAAANAFLDAMDEIAPDAEVHYVAGNHEHRVERWAVNQKVANQKDIEMLHRTFSAENVLRTKERGYRYYPYGQVNEGHTVPNWILLDNLHFTHKVSLAKNAADAALGGTAGNICFGDTHRQDYKPTVLQDGTLRAAWNTGCLCKRQPSYCNTRPTGWTHGYCVRFIDRKTSNFQMIQILIEDGKSLAGHIFNR